MTREVTANRKHKDKLFRALFNDKSALLALYNAVNGTAYGNPDELMINTLEDVLFMGMKNDISFLIDDKMNLYEHQSTYNPNMPLRGLFYIADLLHGYVEMEKLDIYSNSRIHIPFPKYVVFYNGGQDCPDREVLKLSDSYYPQSEEPALEFICILLNINEGHNKELMEKCPLLGEYARFIACIRTFTGQGYQLETAINRSIDICIKENVLADYLRTHREEACHMLLDEVAWTRHKENIRKEEYEKGHTAGLAEGHSAGCAQVIIRSVEAYCKKKNVSVEEACEELSYEVEEYREAKKLLAEG